MANLENVRERSSQGIKPNRLESIKKIVFQYLENWSTIILILLFFLIWELLAQAGKISALVFPAPSKIIKTFVELLISGELLSHFTISLTRVLSGFLVGGGAGLVLGLILGWSSRLRKILDPIVAALHPVPKVSLLPMVIIIFGLGESSRIVMISISTFFPMLINTMAGVLQINPTYFEVAKNYGASKFNEFRKVVLPGSMPLVFTGARLSLKASLTITIAIEMIFSNEGLGSIAWLAWQTMRLTYLFAVIFLISFMGWGTNYLLQLSKKTLLPWHHEVRGSG